ncbi:AraC family transcriptional regulator [Devosia sp. Root413D1]|uniref:AraC family transcriptional regulator n=1 Tax=Devosia sp. Root413D1 TaxID=1736531 RepID=UPI0006FCC533|nr:helix-turn-helix transcriptional regulator [Devosia sp. Root413D1]KQW78091.1 AraC family transcriptional regulator [Devosia sp. Root413D1]
MRQALQYPWTDLDVDRISAPAVSVRIDVGEARTEVPEHQHRKGQLVFALAGGVTCRVPSGLWMVPPHCAVWIPGSLPHSNIATANAKLFFVYLEPGAVDLPDQCCTLSISPLLRELIIELADRESANEADDLLIKVLLAQLPLMPVQQLHLPVSAEPRLASIVNALAANPADRATLGVWAGRVAMSESSLSRLVVQETGLTFGRWRQQLHLIVAIRELSDGATVQQVSADLGYASVASFIAMFKKALGKPPAKYLSSIAHESGSRGPSGRRQGSGRLSA